MEPVHLLHLLLPHLPQGVGGDVKMWQLLQEHREELILLYFHWGWKGETNGVTKELSCDSEYDTICLLYGEN